MAVDKYVGFVDTGNGDALPIGSTLYGTCDTAAATTAKVVTCPAFNRLNTGVTINVKFDHGNTATTPTLNVNSTGALAIKFNGTNAGRWTSGEVVSFTYDGSNWIQNNTFYVNSDTKVTQDYSYNNVNYPILLKFSADPASETKTVKASILTTINPSNGYISVAKISTDGTNYYEIGAAAEKAIGSVTNADTGLVTGGDVWTAIQQASAGSLIYGGVVTSEAGLGTSYTAGTYWIVGSVSAGTTIAGQVVEAGDMIIAHAAYSGTIANDVDVVQANVDRLTDTDIDNAIAAVEAA